jgi:hypothetical protein
MSSPLLDTPTPQSSTLKAPSSVTPDNFFPDFNPPKFLSGLRSQGWSPQMAWLYYSEVDAVGSMQWVSPSAPAVVISAQKTRQALGKRLSAVKSEADMERYFLEWSDTASVPVMNADDALVFWQHVGIDPKVATQRLATKPGKWPQLESALRQAKISWPAVLDQAANDFHRLESLHTHRPHMVSSSRALADMSYAFSVSGLRAFRLPLGAGSTPQAWSEAASNLRSANIALQGRTNWSGPVLGLANRTTLILGVQGMATDGRTVWDPYGTSISIDAGKGWTAVAHEWLHSLDFETGRSMGEGLKPASMSVSAAQTDTASAWAQLSSSLRAPLSGDVRAQWDKEIVAGLPDRWANIETRQSLLRLRAAVDSPLFNRSKTVDGMVEDGMQNGSDATAVRVGVEMLMAEADYMAGHAPKDRSPWVATLERMERVGLAHADKNYPVELEGSLTTNTELAAYAFEVGFPGAHPPLIAESLAGHAPMRLPLTSEAARQRPALDKLFSSLSSWWVVAQTPSQLRRIKP